MSKSGGLGEKTKCGKRTFLILVAVLLLCGAYKVYKYCARYADIRDDDAVMEIILKHKASLRDKDVNIHAKTITADGEYYAVALAESDGNRLYVFLLKRSPVFEAQYRLDGAMESVTDVPISVLYQSTDHVAVAFADISPGMYDSYTVAFGDYTYGRSIGAEEEYILDIYYCPDTECMPTAALRESQ